MVTSENYSFFAQNIFCPKYFFDQKIKDIDNVTQNEKKDDTEPKELIIWERHGGYYWLQYSKRTFDVNDFVPRPDQSSVIDEILEFYTKNKYCVALIHGPKGCGKSMIPILIGKKLQRKTKKKFIFAINSSQLTQVTNSVIYTI